MLFKGVPGTVFALYHPGPQVRAKIQAGHSTPQASGITAGYAEYEGWAPTRTTFYEALYNFWGGSTSSARRRRTSTAARCP